MLFRISCITAITALLVFPITTMSRSMASSFDVIYRFPTPSRGTSPTTLVAGPGGVLYGTTAAGGDMKTCPYGCGTAFALVASGDGYQEQTIYEWRDTLAFPSSLLIDGSGTLYGTTNYGPVGRFGSVFELSPTKSGYSESTLFQFNGANGSAPSSIVKSPDGFLYGTLSSVSNVPNFGGIFRLAPRTLGSFIESIAYQFPDHAHGEVPTILTLLPSGVMFGTTALGGGKGYGVLFDLIPTSNGFLEQTLLDFDAKDGEGPTSQLVFGADGAIYATAEGGHCFGIGCAESTGVAIKLKNDKRQYSDELLHVFQTKNDGTYPSSPLILYQGSFYGTTASGTGIYKNGTIFQITPEKDGYHEQVLHAFTSSEGINPQNLVLGPGGALFGTAQYGGIGGNGTIFRFTP